MKINIRHILVLFLACGVLTSAQIKPNKKEVLLQASKAYYNLKDNGFSGFRCTVEPDWKKYIEDNFNPYGRDVPPLNWLSQVTFAVSIAKDGAVTVDPVGLDKGEIDPRIRQDIVGMINVINGFVQTWGSMAISPPFPQATEGFDVKEEENGYRVTSADGSELVMSREFLISQMSVTVSGSKILMSPRYSKTDAGLLMTNLESDIGNGQVKVSFDIRYQEVDGFKLPGNVVYRLVAPGKRVVVSLALTKYKVTKQ